MKRGFDLFWSILGLIVLAPIFLLVGMAIWLEDKGPVFFRQVRIGKRGDAFSMWKFRTMVVNAESLGISITVGRDPRITRVGSWLRRSKLDELPQLINVLRGQMSLVGPRPEVPAYVAIYTPEQRRVLELKPGITDPASVKYRSESEILAESCDPETYYREHIMPDKIRLNLEYAVGATIWTDLVIILETLGFAPRGKTNRPV